MPKPTLYGVFVAIDEYGANVSNLQGCKNDIILYKETFKKLYENEVEINYDKNFVELLDQKATYQNVVQAFKDSTFDKLSQDDSFVFIFSGHGCREKQAPEFDNHFPEGYSETLVLHDSREAGGMDLADKEIAELLSNIGKKCKNIIVIFDCCHSGSGTRHINDIILGPTRQADSDDTNSLSRTAYNSSGNRLYDSYLNGELKRKYGNDPKLPFTKHILLSACDKKEKARELLYPLNGAFTNYLIDVLVQNPTDDYISLFKKTRHSMRLEGLSQNPRIETNYFFNSHNSFLLNLPKAQVHHDIFKTNNDEWKIDLGAVHGMPTDKEVYLNILNGENIIEADIKEVFVNHSSLNLKSDLPSGLLTTKAKFLSPLAVPLIIQLHTDQAGKKRVSAALENYSPLKFELIENVNDAKYQLSCTENKVSIFDTYSNKEIIAYVGDNEDEIFELTFADLEDISEWERKVEIKNENVRFNPNEIEFILIDKSTGIKYTNQEIIELELTKDQDGEYETEYELQVVNNTKVPIKCSLLAFSSKFAIDKWADNIEVPAITGRNKLEIELESGHDTLFIPKEKLETCDVFKLFISTGQHLDLEFLSQEKLPLIDLFIAYGNVVCSKENSRGGKRDTRPSKKYNNQWLTKEITVKCIKKQFELNSDTVSISENLAIKADKSLTGLIYPRMISKSSYEADEDTIVTQFIDSVDDIELIPLDSLKSLAGVPNCLEFMNVQKSGANEGSDISITLNSVSDEIAVSIVYDGQHFIPLDLQKPEEGKYNFIINELPQKTSNRSLKQAIKLFFIKLKVGRQNDTTHQLKLISLDGAQDLTSISEIKTKLLSFKNPLLVIHGIIGNTKHMVNVASRVIGEGKYDCLLTFDYENLNTPIEVTAGELLRRLKEVGISSNKQISILAHSMGGLVSRHMIEKLGGDKMVDKLVMVGTPNQGSKFAIIGGKYIVQWLPVIFYLINVLRDFKSVTKIFDLATGKLSTSKTLDQMSPNNKDIWLDNLNLGKPPSTNYHIIHGNLTQFLSNKAANKKLIDKAYEKGGKLFYPDEESDLVVSESSMCGVPHAENIITKKEVPSIHMSYFQDELCIDEIVKLLS